MVCSGGSRADKFQVWQASELTSRELPTQQTLDIGTGSDVRPDPEFNI
jgi:hypothetical protein